ncbi:unnamed protein product [Soboliphyme baturini]|uniref:GPR1 FUN34 yaaH family protein n=1 Tax=Soboliphyme baturini TaxID=241478 RepID=A0A183IYY5_9BILA|nr:unnamed protein product [Soboliphyme baturini]
MTKNMEEMKNLVMDQKDDEVKFENIKNYVKTLYDEQKPKFSNPTVLGLAGFGCAVITFQIHNFGWMDRGPTMWVALVLGGILHLGFQEFQTGNNFGYGAFSTFGGLWTCFGLILLGDKMEWYPASKIDMGCMMIVFTVFTGIWLYPTLYMDLALCLMFSDLFLAFIFADIELLTGEVRGPMSKAAATLFLIGGLISWYIMAHFIYLDILKKDVLPVGRAPITIIRSYRTRGADRSNA